MPWYLAVPGGLVIAYIAWTVIAVIVLKVSNKGRP